VKQGSARRRKERKKDYLRRSILRTDNPETTIKITVHKDLSM
jgi:hypothetical protein